MPGDCLPGYARKELELMPGYLSDLGETRPEVEQELATRYVTVRTFGIIFTSAF